MHRATGTNGVSAEIQLKAWVIEEAMRAGLKPRAVYQRVSTGKYPNLKLRRENRRVIFVQPNA